MNTQVPGRIEDFRQLMRHYTEVRELIDRGTPVSAARAYLDRFAASCTDDFLQQVAFDWSTRLPATPPPPPGSHVLANALSVQEWAVTTLATQDSPADREDTKNAAAAQILGIFDQARVDPIYGAMLCACLEAAAPAESERTPVSWWV